MASSAYLADPSTIDWTCPVDWSHPLNRGLLGWWLAVPTSPTGWGGVTWRDLTRRNHGALASMDPPNDWSGAKGRQGGWGSLDFDGTNDTVQVPSFDQDYLTAVAWVYKHSNSGLDAICARDSGGGASRHWYMATSGADLNCALWNTGGSVTNPTATVTLSTGVWYRIGMRYDGANLKLFLNGKTVGTPGTLSGTIRTGSRVIEIGNLAGSFGCDANLDDVRILARPWTDADFATDYALSRNYYRGLLNRIPRPQSSSQDVASGNRRRRVLLCGSTI